MQCRFRSELVEISRHFHGVSVLVNERGIDRYAPVVQGNILRRVLHEIAVGQELPELILRALRPIGVPDFKTKSVRLQEGLRHRQAYRDAMPNERWKIRRINRTTDGVA